MITEKIVIPLLKAIITAVLVALFAASWRIDLPGWKLFFMVLSGVCLAAWVVMIGGNSIVTSHKNQGNDVVTLKPTETRIQITASDPSSAFTHGKFANLPVDLPTLIKVAKWLDNGADFSMAGLSGRYRPLSRSQFESLRLAMIRDGLLFWRDPANHAQGCELTLAGRRVMKYYAGLRGNDHVTPLPQLNKGNTDVTFLPNKARARGRAGGNGRKVIIDR